MTNAPVTCASVFDTQEEALAVALGEISLCVCGHCGFVFNAAFDSELGKTGARYEGSQAASAHFSSFARAVASDWVDRYSLEGRTVIEVGCGDASFLREMLALGVGKAIGIDPLVRVDGPSGANFMPLAEEFGPGHFDLVADALVCRHTLEHIADVAGFLGLVRQWAARRPGRVVLFEVPAAERIFAECAFWDVYYEHCCYFTAVTLRYVFAAAGLEVMSVARVYDGQYLLLEARAATAGWAAPVPVNVEQAAAACSAFALNANDAIANARTMLERIGAQEQPVVLWQGAAKTVGFLTALNRRQFIDSAVDVNPARQGKFLPSSGLPILAPSALLRLRPPYVVLMNPVYFEEVQAELRSMELQTRLLTVDQLLSRDGPVTQ